METVLILKIRVKFKMQAHSVTQSNWVQCGVNLIQSNTPAVVFYSLSSFSSFSLKPQSECIRKLSCLTWKKTKSEAMIPTLIDSCKH